MFMILIQGVLIETDNERRFYVASRVNNFHALAHESPLRMIQKYAWGVSVEFGI